MTWCSECSAVPGFVLAKSAIRCLFVDRFVGSSVPSHVSGQRVSTRGVSLPSAGSQQARFPVVISTMEALRLPASAYPVPYGFGSRPHVFLLWFALAEALPVSVEVAQQAWAFVQPACPFPACCTRGRVRDITGSLAVHPMPLPCSRTPAEPTRPRLRRSRRYCPRELKTEGLSG